jgi:hypothetical protein
MDFCTPSFQRLLDYEEGDRHHPRRGFVKSIGNLADAYEFLCNVADLGAGVMVVDFNLPKELSIAHFREVFRESAILRRLSTPAKNLGYNVESIQHLGGDGCYFGVLQCTVDLAEQFRLIICSHDVKSANNFHSVICKIVDKQIEKCPPGDIRELANIMHTPVVIRDIIQKLPAHRSAMNDSNMNRRIIAATIFKELGIPIQTETVRISEASTASAISMDRVTHDFKCVFLAEEIEEGKRVGILYSHAFRVDDLICGAPWCINISAGFRTYEKNIELTRPDNFSLRGAPMGAPFIALQEQDQLSHAPNIRDYNQLEEIRKKVLWNTDLDVLLTADHRLRQEYNTAIHATETVYHLRDNRVKTWKTVAMYMAAPDIQKIPLDRLLNFSTGPAVTVHYENFMEIMDMWVSIRKYYHHLQKEDTAIDLPDLASIFRTQTKGGKYVSIDKGILGKLLKLHESMLLDLQPKAHPPGPSNRVTPQNYHIRANGIGMTRHDGGTKRPPAQTKATTRRDSVQDQIPGDVAPPLDDRPVPSSYYNSKKPTKSNGTTKTRTMKDPRLGPPPSTKPKQKTRPKRSQYISASGSESDIHGSGDDALYSLRK